jgi:glycosyltransferase involved in cell wall biosynthesis
MIGRFEVIVVDDASVDSTIDKIQDCPGVLVMKTHIRRGYGQALKNGIKRASHEIIMITDGDGSYGTENTGLLLETINEYDLVIGKRHYLPGSTSGIRIFARNLLNAIAGYLSGKKVYDLNSGMRVFRRGFVTKHADIFPSGFSFTSTSTLISLYSGLRIAYVPVNYRRRRGRSKMKANNFFGILYTVIKVAYAYRPWKVIILLSVLLFLCGALLWGLLNVYCWS